MHENAEKINLKRLIFARKAKNFKKKSKKHGYRA